MSFFLHILAINKILWHSGQYLCLRLRPLLREESLHPIDHVERRNIYRWANVFEFHFVKIFQMTIITSIKFEHIGLPFIDCLAIRHHRRNGFFFSLFLYFSATDVFRTFECYACLIANKR